MDTAKDPGAPSVILDPSRLKPGSTVEAKNESEFRAAIEAAGKDEIVVAILGRDRVGYQWEPVEVYWKGAPEYDDRGRLDVPMPRTEELLSAARRHDVRFTKGAVRARILTGA